MMALPRNSFAKALKSRLVLFRFVLDGRTTHVARQFLKLLDVVLSEELFNHKYVIETLLQKMDRWRIHCVVIFRCLGQHSKSRHASSIYSFGVQHGHLG